MSERTKAHNHSDIYIAYKATRRRRRLLSDDGRKAFTDVFHGPLTQETSDREQLFKPNPFLA